jgi:CubicO group peptidase (beta-lactamase class C family)
MDPAGLQALMDEGAAAGVFPGGVLLAAVGDRVACHIAAGRLSRDPASPLVTLDAQYDLASLTKVLSTTILVMILTDRGRLDPERPLKAFWPHAPEDKAGITIARLLAHESGLPAWRPYYQRWVHQPVEQRRAAARRDVLAEPLQAAPGAQAVYSDLNFMLLGFLLEDTARLRQDQLHREWLLEPLGLTGPAYRPLDQGGVDWSRTAATDDAAGRGRTVSNGVHDDNAASLLGVAGHAGLFGTAEEVFSLFNHLRRSYQAVGRARPISSATVRAFFQYAPQAPGSSRALGFDRPSGDHPCPGPRFSENSVGHLGFTGTSLWYDPQKDLTVVLLTNRVHPTAANEAIRDFRPQVHTAVADAV